MTSERKFIEEAIKRVLLKEYLKRKTERSGFGGLDIQRTPMGTRVTLIAERPGMVIGRKGETIKELTDYVQNEFKFDNPQIEVKEESNPNLNPHIMAQKLASALERGWHFRRAGHSTVRRIMSAGAKGCQVIISGKLTGQRHRTEKFREGHIKYCGETKLTWMREGFAVAKKKLGAIGIKVQIMDPNAKLPDEIEVKELKEVATIKTAEGQVVTPQEVELDTGAETELSEAEAAVDTELEAEAGDKVEDKGKKVGKEPEVADDKDKAKEKKPKETKKEKASEKTTKKKRGRKAKEVEEEKVPEPEPEKDEPEEKPEEKEPETEPEPEPTTETPPKDEEPPVEEEEPEQKEEEKVEETEEGKVEDKAEDKAEQTPEVPEEIKEDSPEEPKPTAEETPGPEPEPAPSSTTTTEDKPEEDEENKNTDKTD